MATALAPTGVLRAALNLGNPVLTHGTPDAPSGITVDLARELAARLGVAVTFACFDAARSSFQALVTGAADIGFFALEPAREAELAFTAAYVVIEGVYAVPTGSAITAPDDVDQPGVRVGVKEGSAYDLFLTRTLRHADVVRGTDGIEVFTQRELEVAAGIRQPMTQHVAEHEGLRVLEPRFMQIRQAVAMPPDRGDAAAAFLRQTTASLVASGFVASALSRSGQDPSLAAPP